MVTPTHHTQDELENLASFLVTARRARQVNLGLLQTSVYFVHAMLRRIATRLRNKTPPQLPPHTEDARLRESYRLLLQESLLFHHSVLGPMHVQKKTLVDSEASLFKNCKLYLDLALTECAVKKQRT
jgi:hypothetical protein